MSAKAAASQSLIEVAIRNAGIRKGFKACLYLAQWGIAYEAEGPLSADQLAVWWGESRATSFGNQAKFREAFPGEQTPLRLWELVQNDYRARMGKRAPKATRATQKEVVAQVTGTRWAA